MKITHENTDYELNIEKFLKAGTLKKIHREIENITVGDVFILNNGTGTGARVLILKSYLNHYFYGGLDSIAYSDKLANGLTPYSDLNGSGNDNKSRVIESLNRSEAKYLANIGEHVGKFIESL